MAMLRFLFRRLMAQRLLALGVVLTLAFSIGVMASGPIYTDAAREMILTSTIATATAPTRNVRVDRYGGSGFDWSQADRQVRALASALPVETVVPQGSTTVRIGPTESSLSSVPMVFRAGSSDHLAFRTGSGPGAEEVALPYGLAQRSGLRVGDPVAVWGPSNARATVRVSGIFDPPSSQDAYWFGEDTPFPTGDSNDPVPVVVDQATSEKLSTQLQLTTHFVWDIYLALSGITYSKAVGLPDAYSSFTADIAEQLSAGEQQAHVSSGILVLIARVQRSIADLRVPILLVLAQILVVTLVVLAGVGVLLVSRQSFELAVMHSRGFTARTLLVVQSLQAILAATLALPIGIVMGTLLARFAGATNGPRPGDTGFPTHLSSGSLVFGVATAVIGAIVLALPSIPATRRTILDERRQTSREARPKLAHAPVELIVLPVGVFALAQLRSGTAVAASSTSGTIDPLLLFGPTLVILGASFLVVRALSWGLGSLDGRIGRSGRVSTYLAGRRLGRAPGVAFASAILVVLSVGLLFVSTSYRATTLQNHADAAHAFVGTDWVATVGAPSSGSTGFDRPIPAGMAGAAPLTLEGFRGSYTNSPEGLAVDPSTFRNVSWWRSDFADESLDGLMDRLTPPAVGMELPASARTLDVTVDAPDDATGLELRATFVGHDRQIVSTDPQGIAPGAHNYPLDVEGSARLLSLTFQRPSPAGAQRVPLVIRGATLDSTPVSLDGWEGLRANGASGRLTHDRRGWLFHASFGIGSPIIGIEPKPPAVPAIVSSDLAGQEPTDLQLRIGSRTVPVRVAGTATSFPSFTPGTPFVVLSGPALFALQGAVSDSVPRVTQVWARGDGDPTATLQDAGFPVVGLLSARSIEDQLAEAPQSLAVGLDAAAAIAGLGLVVAGVTATLYFAQRRRDFEFASLRAMGVSSPTVRETIAREQIALVGVSSLAGIALGYVVLRLASAPLLDAVNTSFPTPILVVDVRALTIALIVIVVAVATAVAAATRAVLRSPITAVLRGDPE